MKLSRVFFTFFTEFNLRAQGLSGNNAYTGSFLGLKFMHQDAINNVKDQLSALNAAGEPKFKDVPESVEQPVTVTQAAEAPKVHLSGNRGRIPPFNFFVPSSHRGSDVCGVPHAGTVFNFFQTNGKKMELSPLAMDGCTSNVLFYKSND